MTVKELIELLSKEDSNRLVVMSKGGEGNGFSPFADMETGAYVAETTWSGEFELSEPEEAVDGVPALCLWPKN